MKHDKVFNDVQILYGYYLVLDFHAYSNANQKKKQNIFCKGI